MVSRAGLKLTSTPMSVGRLSSLDAAKTTWSIILRRPVVSSSRRVRSVSSSSAAPTSGMMGNSAESTPFMLASVRRQCMWSVCVRTCSSMSMRSGGRLFTNSVSSRAGTVIAPSSSTLAPIQQVTPMSRLVAANRN